MIEAGYTCKGGGLTGRDVCTETCGDGMCITYACDDGNLLGGDGCSSACQIEPGWKCPTCSNCVPICGDGIVVKGEQCDDGNSIANDGCTACIIDNGFACVTYPKPTLISSWCYPVTWPKIIGKF